VAPKSCPSAVFGVAAEQEDPLGTESLRGDHAAQPDGAVADHSDRLAGADIGREGRVVAGAHHIGKREQRRHEFVVRTDRQDHECPLGLRNTHRFALTAVDVVAAVSAAMETGALQPFAAEGTGSIRPEERRDDEVADLDGLHVGADRLDDTDELVPHSPAGIVVRHRLVRPEIATADRGARDLNERIGRVDQPGVRNILDANIAGSVHEGGAHTQ